MPSKTRRIRGGLNTPKKDTPKKDTYILVNPDIDQEDDYVLAADSLGRNPSLGKKPSLSASKNALPDVVWDQRVDYFKLFDSIVKGQNITIDDLKTKISAISKKIKKENEKEIYYEILQNIRQLNLKVNKDNKNKFYLPKNEDKAMKNLSDLFQDQTSVLSFKNNIETLYNKLIKILNKHNKKTLKRKISRSQLVVSHRIENQPTIKTINI